MRSALLVLLLSGAALSGCLHAPAQDGATPGSAPPARIPIDVWTANLTKARFTGIANSLAATVAPDGTRLTLTVHLPQGLPPGARIPTLLEITPYEAFVKANVDVPAAVPTHAPGRAWQPYVLAGAAYVEADARGSNGSGGCLDFGGSADRSDAQVFAAWVRAQPWSDGRVVTDGVSHPGMGSVVAHAAVPGLTGALAHAPVVSYYQDEWYQGARFEDQANGAAYQAVELSPDLASDPDRLTAQAAPCTGRTTLDFNAPDGTFTPLWVDRDLSRHLPANRTPILLTQGFIDNNVHPDHVQRYWDALPADYPKSVVWGYWYHGYPTMKHHPLKEFEDLRHRWLDALLFGAANGLGQEPRVLVEDSNHTWHEGHDWPLEPSERVTLATSGGDALTLTPGAATAGQASYKDTPGAVRGVWKDAHAAFRTAPLEAARLVNGAPTVHLVASSDQASTKWVAYLLDEAPDGSWQRISHGYADSHTWDGEDQWRDLVPGQAYTWTLQLMPTAVVVEKGHRVTLLIASEDSHSVGQPGRDRPCFDDRLDGCYDPSGILPDATAGRATNTVRTGPGGTSVELAWVDPALTAKPT
ncbi:MAG: CocE/NonD family hydrolase [Thermoplasmatota archaeon]